MTELEGGDVADPSWEFVSQHEQGFGLKPPILETENTALLAVCHLKPKHLA